MKLETLVLGLIETNCYFISEGSSLLIIDPASSSRRLIEKINNSYDGRVTAILLTHGHFDHIGAVDALVRTYGCPVYGCRDDERLFTDEKVNSMAGMSATVKSEITWLEDDIITLGGIEVKVYYTPGHSPGSVMFEIGGMLFSGDTIFYEGIGRTDLYGGSFSQLKQSAEILNRLPYDMIIYPGHGPETTVGHELRYNPYL